MLWSVQRKRVKAVAGLELTDKPKVEYIVGEALEKELDALQSSLRR